MRRFMFADDDVICSSMLPNGRAATGVNDTMSLRLIPAISAVSGVRKLELPIIKSARAYSYTVMDPGSMIHRQSHNSQLIVLGSGTFDAVVNDDVFSDLGEADWLYVPPDTPYRLSSTSGGVFVTALESVPRSQPRTRQHVVRRFLFAERDVLSSTMMPRDQGPGDATSLRRPFSDSDAPGVQEYEIPILKDSKSYTYTMFDAGGVVRPHAHDEGQLRVVTRGIFDFDVEGRNFSDLRPGDWIYLPKDTSYSIVCRAAGAMLQPYGMSCKCTGG